MEKFDYLKKYEDAYYEVNRAGIIANNKNDYGLAAIQIRKSMELLINCFIKENKINILKSDSLSYKVMRICDDLKLKGLEKEAGLFERVTDKINFRVFADRKNYEDLSKSFDVICQRLILGNGTIEYSGPEHRMPVNYFKMENEDIKSIYYEIQNYRNYDPEFGLYKMKAVAVYSLLKIGKKYGVAGVESNIRNFNKIDFDKFEKKVNSKGDILVVEAIKKVINYSNDVQKRTIKDGEFDMQIFENLGTILDSIGYQPPQSNLWLARKNVRNEERLEVQKEKGHIIKTYKDLGISKEEFEKFNEQEQLIIKKFITADKHAVINPSISIMALSDLFKKTLDFLCKENIEYSAKFKMLTGQSNNPYASVAFADANINFEKFNSNYKGYCKYREAITYALYDLNINPKIVDLLQSNFNTNLYVDTNMVDLQDYVKAIYSYDELSMYYSRKLMNILEKGIFIKSGARVPEVLRGQTKDEINKSIISSNLGNTLGNNRSMSFSNLLYLNKESTIRELDENEIAEIKQSSKSIDEWYEKELSKRKINTLNTNAFKYNGSISKNKQAEGMKDSNTTTQSTVQYFENAVEEPSTGIKKDEYNKEIVPIGVIFDGATYSGAKQKKLKGVVSNERFSDDEYRANIDEDLNSLEEVERIINSLEINKE